MLTLNDCIELCGLTPDEVIAIAEHQHIPEIAAAELGGPRGAQARARAQALADLNQFGATRAV